MTFKVQIIMALAASTLMSSTALAQAGSSGPVAGAADATKVTAANRENREEFNRAAGRANKKTARVKAEIVKPATAADIIAGSEIRDTQGEVIGAVESVDAEGAIVANGATRIRVPLEGFGKNSKGLVLNMTKAQFEAAVAQATAKPQG